MACGIRSCGTSNCSVCISWCVQLILNWFVLLWFILYRDTITSYYCTWLGWWFCILKIRALLVLSLSDDLPHYLSCHFCNYCCEIFNGQIALFCYLLTPCFVLQFDIFELIDRALTFWCYVELSICSWNYLAVYIFMTYFSDWSFSHWIFGYWYIFRVSFVVIVICLGGDWLQFGRNVETEWYIRRWRGYKTTGTFAKVLSYLGSGNFCFTYSVILEFCREYSFWLFFCLIFVWKQDSVCVLPSLVNMMKFHVEEISLHSAVCVHIFSLWWGTVHLPLWSVEEYHL